MKGKRIIPVKKRIRKEEEAVSAPESSPAASFPSSSLPSIAIVGRPNVGKSSLFNAILGRRLAIVHFDSGVTRDRVSEPCLWKKRLFLLTDTGGLGMYCGETRGLSFWDKMIAEQADAAIETADVILFVVDVQAGLNPLDSGIAERLRTCGKKVILVANKADNPEDVSHADEFHALGFDSVYPVSCLHRTGIGDVMEAALSGLIRIDADSIPRESRFKIAVLGRPNVGKSSLVNRLLGETRVIVSDVPGTTRDAVDSELTLDCDGVEVPALLVDTAGLRKKSKVDGAVEQYSMMRAAAALESCDLVLFVLEASVGEATSQDKTIARMIEESGKACILVVNKWDVRLENSTKESILKEVRYTLPKMPYAPVVFLSAATGWNFQELYRTITQVRTQLSVRIATSQLNRVIQEAVDRNLPPVIGVKPLKIYYGAMVAGAPPRFVLFVNDPKLCAETYRTYLVNCFRRSFGLTGLPIRIRLEARSRRDLSEVVHHAGSTHRKKIANAKQYKDEMARRREIRIRKKRKAVLP